MYTTYIIICAFNTYPNAKLLKTINAVIVLYSFLPHKYKEYILMSKIM